MKTELMGSRSAVLSFLIYCLQLRSLECENKTDGLKVSSTFFFDILSLAQVTGV